MKKQLLLVFAALIPLLVSAQTKVEIDGIWYNLDSASHQAEVISGSRKYSGSIIIPSMVTYVSVEYSVTSIGERAFSYCHRLNTINIPESVTSIGDWAFISCSSLTAITIPENSQLTSIGAYAFQYCRRLNIINIPESVTSIGDWAFMSCGSLTAITIPKNSQLTSIGAHAFQFCHRLTSINVPEGVTSIGRKAFYNCGRLTTINIPESVTSIGNYAFWQCRRLTDIAIGVTSIGSYAFPNRKNKGFEPHLNVGIAGSLSGYSGYHYGEMERKPSLSLNLSGEYHFSPYSGARLTYSGDLSSIGFDYMFDVSTLFAGYTSDRRLDVALAYGPMIGKQMVGCQIGLPIQFHMNKNWGISFEPRATLTNYYSDFRGSTSILIGVKYNFK